MMYMDKRGQLLIGKKRAGRIKTANPFVFRTLSWLRGLGFNGIFYPCPQRAEVKESLFTSAKGDVDMLLRFGEWQVP
jgi:hypothetical protein